MRSASFFFLSVSLHAAVLAYPVTFASRNQGAAIRVTILPAEMESGGGGASDGSNSAPKSKRNSQPRPAASPSLEVKPAENSDRQTIAVAKVEKASDSSTAFSSALAAPSAADIAPASGATDTVGMGAGATGGAGLGGYGFGGHGAGSGNGNGDGAGSGSGSAVSGPVLTQARYRETLKPNYPENARREGREGRVLLRVLVDDQGRSKRVEINTSSGSDALDRAAAEAIQRWRFHPARYGDRPVESWLRVPIEFHLQDAKP